jgi:hypothetical protein
MAIKKKTKKKTKKAATKKSAKATKRSSKKISKKTVARKSAAPKKRLTAKPAAKSAKKPTSPSPRKPSKAAPARRGKQENIETVTFEPKGLGPRSGGQSGDLQGLSNRAGADSESVDELLEEGNAFEAEVVKGIEDVPDADEDEVRTRQFPADDVPAEYDGIGTVR